MSLFGTRTSIRNEEERELKLTPMEGKRATNSAGLVDNRLFNGDNKLIVFQDFDGLWTCKYSVGGVPPQLKQKFTGYSDLLRHVTKYFKTRNVEVKD